ncbi:MAG: hypothetical protein IMZ47_01190 [Firmicutes bacterium]|nr:hypothetical protein [Bacillota bacterium]
MSRQNTKGKSKYESPILVPLGEMARGSGACTGGSSVATAVTCSPGAADVSLACTCGPSPTYSSGIDCTAGYYATQDCTAGPTANRNCTAGTCAQSACTAGTAARSACTAGTSNIGA